MRIIQKKVLQQIVNVYKTIAIEILKIKIYVFLINIHFENLLQNSIIYISVRRLINVIDIIIKRIQKDLMLKRKKKLKLRMILLYMKKR